MKPNKVNILLVDDKAVNLYALEQLLYRDDRVFFSANSGEDALKMALNKSFDLIIMDVQMPEMNGFEVAQILKSNKRTKDIPIIFASAERKEQEHMMKGFEEGGIDYLFKPLDPELTKAKVDAQIRIQLQKRELIEKNAELEKYVLLINNSADLICTLDAKSLKFEEVNDAVITILGYTPQEIRGMSLTLYISTEDRAILQQKKLKEGEKISFETRIYSKTRAIKWLNWSVVVKGGKWYANARDITDIKQVEEIKSYLATVVKQSNDAIYLHDPQGKIISWNAGAEEIYGYTEEEALKMKISNIIPSYLLHDTVETIQRTIGGDKILDIEAKRITKHGRIIDVLFSASVVLDSSNNLKSIAITERDITQQKLADEQIQSLNADLQKNIIQLQSANKELESFSYSISHDLRAPLRAINGYAQILAEDYGKEPDSESKSFINKIIRNATNMGTLIDDLLAFSQMSRKQLMKANVDMDKMVAEIYMETESHEKGRAMEFIIHQLPVAQADNSTLKQVWVNLISNALKYTRHKGKAIIEIGSMPKGSEVIYYVKDNGAGFDMKYADKLFGVFQRLHASTEFEGTGIGLAIVQRIIDKHGGRVWAEGEVGVGATFYFTLPVVN